MIEDPVLRQRYEFRNGTVEFWVDPGGGVPPHIHPTFEERFEVLEGDEVTFWAGGEKHPRGPGGKVTVPKGVKHRYKNTGTQTAHVICNADPPDPELEGFLTTAAALGRAGAFTRQGIPKKLSTLLPLALMVYTYRDSTVILNPPRFIQRLLIFPLGRLAERRAVRLPAQDAAD